MKLVLSRTKKGFCVSHAGLVYLAVHGHADAEKIYDARTHNQEYYAIPYLRRDDPLLVEMVERLSPHPETFMSHLEVVCVNPHRPYLLFSHQGHETLYYPSVRSTTHETQ